MPSCRQCRARKVRCDRLPRQCSGCSRLAVPCIYPETKPGSVSTARTTSAAVVAASPSGIYSRFRLQQPGQQDPTPQTVKRYQQDRDAEAGLKRRRTQHACLTCRRDKLKCSGTDPCLHCEKRNTVCDWVDGTSAWDNPVVVSSRLSPPLRRQTQSRLSPISIIDEPGYSPTSEDPRSSCSATTTCNESEAYEYLSNETVRRYIDAYFLYGHSSGFLFPILLKSLVLADWKSSQIHPLLLKAIVAFGVCLHHDQKDDEDYEQRDSSNPVTSLHNGQVWLEDVRRNILLGSLRERPSLALVQVLLILMRYYLLTDLGRIESWNLLALASRFIFSLALNYEDSSESVNATIRETRRRAVWAVYAIDQLLCGGIDDLSVCHQARLHIRLPCCEQSFQRGIPSTAPFVHSNSAVPPSNNRGNDHEGMDMLAYYLQLLGHRHKILQYTKRLRLASTNPESSKHELASLQHGLTAFATMLPTHLRNTPQNVVLMAHANDADADWYLHLHMLFLQCHCDLYRHTVPHLREALPPDVIRLCSPAYVIACQDACLDAAVALCRLWTDARQADVSRNGSRALFLAACMYQVAQILLHLRHRLDSNENGENGHRRRDQAGDQGKSAQSVSATARLAESLCDALMLLGDSQHPTMLMGRPHVDEIRKMIALLRLSEKEAAGLLAKNPDVPRNSRLYMSMASRHSLLETLSEDSTESAAAGQKTVGDDGSVVVAEDAEDAERADSIQNTTFLATAPSNHDFGVAMQEVGSVANAPTDDGSSTDGLLEEVLPWGLDSYYDPMLGLVAGDNLEDHLCDGMMQPYAYGPAYGQD